MMIKAAAHDDERFADDPDYREWIMRHLIRTADIGICDVRTTREDTEFPDFFREFAKTESRFKLPDKTVVISFVHEGRSNQPIDFSHESSGTKKLFNIAGDWWRLANKSVTLFADGNQCKPSSTIARSLSPSN